MRWYLTSGPAKALMVTALAAGLLGGVWLALPGANNAWNSYLAEAAPTITATAEPAPTVTELPSGVPGAVIALANRIDDAEKLLAENPSPKAGDAERKALTTTMDAAKDVLDGAKTTYDALVQEKAELDTAIAAFEKHVKDKASPTPTPAPADPEPVAPAPDPEPVAPAPAPEPEPAVNTWSVSCSGSAVATVTVDGNTYQTTGGSGTYSQSFNWSYEVADASGGSCSGG